ncbi:MAG: aspartate/glutamate racemase family protein [Burkholderiales bacterium]|nr:aspartate/glutamate racemase family protein [Burkholderiales bacterium]
MGPLAGAWFVQRLVQLTPAHADQEHIPVILRNDPRIPDRSAAKIGCGADPFDAMAEGMRFLEGAGADLIAVPCNTAHLWYDDLCATVSSPVLHIVEAVVRDLARRGLRGGKVGILGTPATLATGLYQRFLADAGYVPLTPSRDRIERFCEQPIKLVKANRLGEACSPVACAVRDFAEKGAAAVVLGCTELPLALPHAQRSGLGVCVVDSIDALAQAVIEVFAGRSVPTPRPTSPLRHVA